MKVTPDNTGLLPQNPGIYKYHNKEGKLIYVGKAKNIRKRVKSYFTKQKGQSLKTHKLISEIEEIEVVITPTEFDALLLENNLIKVNQPKYNILLKDDKSFPYICVSNDRFPRIYSSRQLIKSKGTYYGPYTSVVAMNNVLSLIQKLYTIRNCKYNLSEKNVAAKKYNLCLEYHIGNCQGPCEGLQEEEDYLKDVKQAESILKGNLSVVRQHFKNQMQTAADNLEYEKAQLAKEKLDLLEKFSTKTLVVNPKLGDLHILTIIDDSPASIVNYMFIKQGAIIQSQTEVVKNQLELSQEQILEQIAGQFMGLETADEQVIWS
jgi:excinuclease ABC subunit C